MRIYICMVLAFWSVTTNGCSSEQTQDAGNSEKQVVEGQDERVSREPMADVVEVGRFVLTEETLLLEYRVNNIYSHDIWVCEDIDAAGPIGPIMGRYDGPPVVETIITDDILQIMLIGNMERNIHNHEKQVWMRYRRLAPHEERSQTIHLAVPVQEQSPVFQGHHPRESRKEPRVVHQVLFRVGFFKGDLSALLAQSRERNLPFPNWHSDPEPGEFSTYTPPPSKDPNVAFIPFEWEGTRLLEQAAQFTITDVNVPAQVYTPRIRRRWSYQGRPGKWTIKGSGSEW